MQTMMQYSDMSGPAIARLIGANGGGGEEADEEGAEAAARSAATHAALRTVLGDMLPGTG